MLKIGDALQGLIALLSNSAFMLALHVILGAMLGAALSAHNENIFLQQQFKYESSLSFTACACKGTTHACKSPPQALHCCLFILNFPSIAVGCSVWQNDTGVVIITKSRVLREALHKPFSGR